MPHTHSHGTSVEWYTLHIPFSIFELYQSSNCVIAGESYTDEQTKHSKVTEMRISYSPSAECQTHTHTAIHHKHSTNAMPAPWLPQNTHIHRTSVEMQFTHFHICHAVSFAFAFVVCFPFVLEDHARAFSLLECTGFWNVSYMKWACLVWYTRHHPLLLVTIMILYGLHVMVSWLCSAMVLLCTVNGLTLLRLIVFHKRRFRIATTANLLETVNIEAILICSNVSQQRAHIAVFFFLLRKLEVNYLHCAAYKNRRWQTSAWETRLMLLGLRRLSGRLHQIEMWMWTKICVSKAPFVSWD